MNRPRRAPANEARRRQWVTGLRAVVLAVAAGILCWPLTTGWGLAAALVGAALGAMVGDIAGRSSLRLSSGLAVAVGVLLVGVWLARRVVSFTIVADLLGPLVVLALGELALWFAVTGPVVFALRFLARRRPTLAVLEVLAVAGATAAAFAAHRDGMVHRPLTIGDWAWSRGLDPALIFLVLGGLGALLLAGLLVQEGRRRRLPLHFAGLVVVALVLTLFVRVEGLPKPDPAGDLGLTGEPDSGSEGDDEQSAEREQGEGDQTENDRHELGDLDFQDDYGDSGQQSPLAVVLLHDDYSPPPGVYYFRQSAFSQFNGRRLVQSTRDDTDRDIIRRFPFQPLTVQDAPAASGGRKPLVTTVGLMVDHVRPFALDSPVTLRPSSNPNPLRFQRTFEVRSHVQILPYGDLIGRRAGDPSWSEAQWRHYTEAPSDPRYGQLARAALDRLQDAYRDDPLARALAIKDYLDENGIYSRRSGHSGSDDPTASFLFGDLTGYCVHFAHAAAYLFRSLDVPARVAAGYAVEESERAGGSTVLIRGGNAHAWPEIYLDRVGWVVVDLTPHQSLDEPIPAPDQRLQQMLGEMMRSAEGDDDFGDQVREAFDWRTLFERLAAFLALVLVVAYAIKLWRRMAPRWAAPDALPRIGYRAGLDRLAELGLRRRWGESREGFTRRIADVVPSFKPLTALHLSDALGGGRPASTDDIRRLLAGLDAELTSRIPTWRRLLGALDPIPWTRVR
ncbi:MAG: transglutaminase domain-containing protein [Acidobacteriota bacterium]